MTEPYTLDRRRLYMTTTHRPKGLASAAACVIGGGDYNEVSDIQPHERHYLAAEVRELAGMLGVPVPAGWTEEDETPPSEV